METVVTSRDNTQVKLLFALLQRKKDRDKTGLFVCEGLRLCSDALHSGVPITLLVLTPQAEKRYPQTAQLRAAAAQTMLVSEDLAAKIGDTQTPQGVFAVCEKLDIHHCAAKINEGGHFLLLEHMQDPGNLGAILRTADALQIDAVFLSKGCSDLYSPKVLRGSMGGLFRLSIMENQDLSEQATNLQQAGIPVYAAALTAQAALAGSVDFSRGGAIVIGNEGAGISDTLHATCTGSIRIPMGEKSNSLNASIAAGILMWEMRRSKMKGIGMEHA